MTIELKVAAEKNMSIQNDKYLVPMIYDGLLSLAKPNSHNLNRIYYI